MDDSFRSGDCHDGIHGPQIISERYIYGMVSDIGASHQATHGMASAVAMTTVPTIDLVENAKQLQKLEAELYANMEQINKANPQAVGTQNALLERIGGVNDTKKQVFMLLQERYQDANENLSHDKLALESQMRVLAIAEEQLVQFKKAINSQKEYVSTQERIAEIDEYEFESSLASKNMAYTLFLGLAAVAAELAVIYVLPGVLAKRNPGNSWSPSSTFKNVMTGIVSVTIVLTLIYLGKQWYDMQGRSNLVYSDYTFGGLYGHPGNGAPGETVFQHDKHFFEKIGHSAENTASHLGETIAEGQHAIQRGASQALSGIAKTGMATQGASSATTSKIGHDATAPSHTSIADPSLSAGGIRQTDQPHIKGAPPVGVATAGVENFAVF